MKPKFNGIIANGFLRVGIKCDILEKKARKNSTTLHEYLKIVEEFRIKQEELFKELEMSLNNLNGGNK